MRDTQSRDRPQSPLKAGQVLARLADAAAHELPCDHDPAISLSRARGAAWHIEEATVFKLVAGNDRRADPVARYLKQQGLGLTSTASVADALAQRSPRHRLGVGIWRLVLLFRHLLPGTANSQSNVEIKGTLQT